MKNAIVIGATSGIGHELAILLAQSTYKVGITGRRKENLEQLKATEPEKFVTSSFDCTADSNSDKLDELVKEMGGLDLLVISSGIGFLNSTLDFNLEQRTNQLNVIAFTEIANWAFTYFEKQGRGHLVGISSIAGVRGNKDVPAYNASKAFQISYLESLRQKARKTGNPIYVTDIRPGLVDTEMAKGEGLFWVAPKEKAARQIYHLIQKKRDVGYVTKRWGIVAVILKAIPNCIYKRL